jgi:HB1, ASXL, restriction endonuclease HTH domain
MATTRKSTAKSTTARKPATRKPRAAKPTAAATPAPPAELAELELPASFVGAVVPATRVSGRDAVAKVLADGQERTAKEITSAAVKLVRPAMTGKTPEATLGALLYTQAKKDDGLVERTGKGTFRLRPTEAS